MLEEHNSLTVMPAIKGVSQGFYSLGEFYVPKSAIGTLLTDLHTRTSQQMHIDHMWLCTTGNPGIEIGFINDTGDYQLWYSILYTDFSLEEVITALAQEFQEGEL